MPTPELPGWNLRLEVLDKCDKSDTIFEPVEVASGLRTNVLLVQAEDNRDDTTGWLWLAKSIVFERSANSACWALNSNGPPSEILLFPKSTGANSNGPPSETLLFPKNTGA